MSDKHDDSRRNRSEAGGPARSARRSFAALGRRAREADRRAGVVNAVRALRRLAPGGDQLSARPPARTSDRLARLIAAVGADQPSATRELGLVAIQPWQAVAGPTVAGRDGEVSIVFTDLVEFSDWALRAGDDQVLRLLREVGRVSEAAIARHGGRMVKSLGDGLMAVFAVQGMSGHHRFWGEPFLRMLERDYDVVA